MRMAAPLIYSVLPARQHCRLDPMILQFDSHRRPYDFDFWRMASVLRFMKAILLDCARGPIMREDDDAEPRFSVVRLGPVSADGLFSYNASSLSPPRSGRRKMPFRRTRAQVYVFICRVPDIPLYSPGSRHSPTLHIGKDARLAHFSRPSTSSALPAAYLFSNRHFLPAFRHATAEGPRFSMSLFTTGAAACAGSYFFAMHSVDWPGRFGASIH